MEALEDLVAEAYLIYYVDDVKVIGQSVKELTVNLLAAPLRFMEFGLFLGAQACKPQ